MSSADESSYVSVPVSRYCRIGIGTVLMIYGVVLVLLLATGWGELTNLKCEKASANADDKRKGNEQPATANSQGASDANDGDSCWRFWPRCLVGASPETRLIVIVILASALGAYIHTATSFADFVGNQRLRVSWLWWYMLRPILGVGLGLLTYFAYRTGMLSGTADASALNPFGIAAVSGVAGMFSKKAADALSAVFDSVIKTPKAGDEVRKDAVTAKVDEQRKEAAE
jgi:hypothetical protein